MNIFKAITNKLTEQKSNEARAEKDREDRGMAYLCNYLTAGGCEYEVFPKNTPYETFAGRYDVLYEQGRQGGFTPVLVRLTDSIVDSIMCSFDSYEAEDSKDGQAQMRQKILSEAANIDGKAFLDREFKSLSVDYHVTGEKLYGKFRKETASNRFISFREDEPVLLVKVPTANPWELPAWFPFGACNYDYTAENFIAVFKRWYDIYGAVPAVVCHDIWEMKLHKPPVQDNDSAEKLAEEQFAFCPDIVWQGMETIRALASQLKGSTTWYFWWD